MRLLYTCRKQDGRLVVESRDERAFDWREEAEVASHEEADAVKAGLSDGVAFATVRPPDLRPFLGR